MTNSTYDIIALMRERLEDGNNWTKNFFAVDDKGKMINPLDERACKWCLTGTMHYVIKMQRINMSAMSAMHQNLPDGYKRVTEFNDADETEHSDIVDLLDKTLGFLKNEENGSKDGTDTSETDA